MGNEYGYGKSFFPKEIVLVIIAVILFGAGMIFGPHLLSATNSGENTVANPNPVNPIEIPKAGDTGQLPVVNETTNGAIIPATTPVTTITEMPVEYIDNTFDYLSMGGVGVLYIRQPTGSTVWSGHFVVKKEDINKISSITVGKTTLRNFSVTPAGNQMYILAQILPAKTPVEFDGQIFSYKNLPMAKENYVYNTNYAKFLPGKPFILAVPVQRWDETKFVSFEINSQ